MRVRPERDAEELHVNLVLILVSESTNYLSMNIA